MRALDDILFGFLIFFAIDRFIRLFSNTVVEPFMKKRTNDEIVIDNYKLLSEIAFLILACFIVYRFRKQISRIAN
jgi:hypothetical protein